MATTSIDTPRELIEYLALTRAGFSREQALNEIDKSRRVSPRRLLGHDFCAECLQLVTKDICYSCGQPRPDHPTEAAVIVKLWKWLQEQVAAARKEIRGNS